MPQVITFSPPIRRPQLPTPPLLSSPHLPSPLAAASVSSRAHRRRVPSPEHSGSDTLDTWDAPRTAGSSPPSRPDTECGAAGPRRTPTWPTDAHRDEARRKMLGSTLDLVDALCEASIMLKDVPAARRNTALHAALQSIDLEIQQAHECGISVVFPMLGADERVLRVPHEESVLLGSREKAPYLLTVEVLTPQPERFLPTALTVAASRRASATSVGSSAEMHGHLVPPRPPLHPAEVPSVPETRELPAMPLAHVPSHGTYRKLFGEPPQHRRGEQAQAQAQSLRGEAMRRHREERMAQGTPMERALASLRDGAPAVAVSIEVVQECPRDAGGDGPAAKDSGLFFGLKRAIGLCSAPPSAGERGAVKERVVVEFKLNAGVDLEVRSPKRPSHARVPSMEALEMMRKSMTRKHAAPGMPKAAKRLTAPLSSFVKRSASKSTSSSSPSPSHAPSEHQRVDDMAVVRPRRPFPLVTPLEFLTVPHVLRHVTR